MGYHNGQVATVLLRKPRAAIADRASATDWWARFLSSVRFRHSRSLTGRPGTASSGAEIASSRSPRPNSPAQPETRLRGFVRSMCRRGPRPSHSSARHAVHRGWTATRRRVLPASRKPLHRQPPIGNTESWTFSTFETQHHNGLPHLPRIVFLPPDFENNANYPVDRTVINLASVGTGSMTGTVRLPGQCSGSTTFSRIPRTRRRPGSGPPEGPGPERTPLAGPRRPRNRPESMCRGGWRPHTLCHCPVRLERPRSPRDGQLNHRPAVHRPPAVRRPNEPRPPGWRGRASPAGIGEHGTSFAQRTGPGQQRHPHTDEKGVPMSTRRASPPGRD